MDVNNQNLSLSLFSYLFKVVGSEDVVRTRRRIFNVIEYLNRKNEFSYICSGSKAEGLDLDGSDFDLMIVKNLCPVYENIEDRTIINKKRNEKVSLIMDDNVTKPGYTRLKVYSDLNTDLDFHDYYYNIGYDTFLSSKAFRENTGITSDDIVTHGPCKSDVMGFVDIALSLQCQKWIVQADTWKHRSRSSWPHNRLIENIVQYGVLFVPIGCKNSPYEDFEFRISFNYAEKKLVSSFSHVQLLCYALLKVILKHFIKPKYGDLLCSYFLKTIMFWVSEETEESIWQPQNLLRCFDRCFKRLVYCVTYSTCLHYFIPELYFFEDRFSKSEHASLASTLQSLYKSGWQCVLQTNLFSSFNLPARIVYSVSALQSVGFTNMIIRHVSDNVLLLTIVRSVFGSLHLPGSKYTLSLCLRQCNGLHRLFI